VRIDQIRLYSRPYKFKIAAFVLPFCTSVDIAGGGTMMVVNVEQTTKIIDALTSTNYQVQNDKKVFRRKGC